METRRDFLGKGLASLAALSSLGGWRHSLGAESDHPILVVFELSGGNDGLNTVVPFGDDAYYRHRPKLGIKREDLLELDDHFGLNPGLKGLERLWREEKLAIVHGCGYENPSFSHFTSMAYWHTGAPHSGDAYGWVGRLAATMAPEAIPNYIVNVDSSQTLAVSGPVHTPVVFDEPDRFKRNAFDHQHQVLSPAPEAEHQNDVAEFLAEVAISAKHASRMVRHAWQKYASPVDYGLVPNDLDKIAACIAEGFPTPLYYTAFRNNAFDTHVQQPALHRRLLSYAGDALHGFIKDMERIGQAHRVVVLVFSEFGRRVPENTNLGTDHGAANNMMVLGNPVRGGHYGELPSLVDLDPGDNLNFTTDFRRVYASVIDNWLKVGKSGEILKGDFETLPIIA
ncbi:MAG: DUF1501 domain-containing protein [Pseudomonadota bacterium]